jgi:hypothetical protein
MRQLPDIAAVEIQKLRDDGIVLTDDDIVWLASLGWKVENPKAKTMEASGIIDGIQLSNNQVLKPLTVGASKWLEKYGPLFQDANDIYAVAFAMACPREVIKLETTRQSVEAVYNWSSKLNITHQELFSAVARVLSDDDPKQPKEEKARPDTDDIISMLVSITGLSFEYWEKQTWIKVNKAYSGAMKYAALISQRDMDPETQESKTALKKLILAINEIRNREKEDGKERN